MPPEPPRIDNAPYDALPHGGLTVEGWSRAGVQTYWRVPELRVGFDFGAAPWDFLATPTWFVSHAHLDHLVALPTFLARRATMKLPPPTVYVPAEVVDGVSALLAAWRVLDRGPQDCTLIGMAPGDAIDLSATHFVTAFATHHPVPSRGYVVWERRHKLKEEFVNLPGDTLKELRESGVSLTTDVPVPLVCYTGDTGPAGLDADPAVYKAKILITELSFARPEQSRETIHRFGHLHLEDFVERADRFENEVIVAGHVTTRDSPEDVSKLANERMPPGLRARLKIWGSSDV